MTIAIHNRQGSFSDRWIEYSRENQIPYKVVNAYDSDIIQQIKECSGFMWHWHHGDPKAILFARQLIYSIEAMGIPVFPNAKTCWHFDDKVGQKYLLEAVEAPLVPSHVFYDRKQAMDWVERTDLPKVFKLRVGAGSQNVRLVKNRTEAKELVDQAFSKGFPVQQVFSDVRNKVSLGIKKGTLQQKILRSPKTIRNILQNRRSLSREKGYVYFQDFIPNNDHDIRIVVIGKKASGMKRMCRKNDFRASGSGEKNFSHEVIDPRCVKLSFEVSEQLGLQSVAFDYIFDVEQQPLIVEMSYCYQTSTYDGYWDRDLEWHEGPFDPCGWMVDSLLMKSIK